MPQHWFCPNGHRWEGTAPGVCPVCGSTQSTTIKVVAVQPSDEQAHRSAASSTPAATDETLCRPSSSPPPSPSLPTVEETLDRPPPRPAAKPSPPLASPAPDAFGDTLVKPNASPHTGAGPREAATKVDQTLARSTPETARPVPDAHDARDDYEILGVLGRGGMGVVYKARQKGLNRLTALKMILAGTHAGPEQLARFHAEAEAVAQLQHPNIVQIYEVGQRDGRPFFSLEVLDGGSLAQKLNGTPLPHRQAAQMLEALARAIHFAHEHGIVHRDLKPANILLATDGTPKITDFGLAKRLEDDSAHTGTGAVLGTPSYMAPEQAAGRTREVGPLADVYSLGAILYDCVTGRPPFRGETVLDTLQQVQSADPVPPTRLQPRVPSDLETICLKCLQKEPHKRYASAAALADDLHRFLDGQPIQARPVGLVEWALKWARRRPAVAALLAILAVVLSGSFVSLFALWQHAEHERATADRLRGSAVKAAAEAEDARKDAESARDEARLSYRRKRRLLYATHMNLVQAALQDGHFKRAKDLLRDMAVRKPGEADLRAFEWYYLWRLCNSDRLKLQGHTNLVTLVAFSPARTYLATAGLDHQVKVWLRKSGRELHTLPRQGRPVRGLAFSPDEKRLAAAGADGAVRLWDVKSGTEIRFGKDQKPLRGHLEGATAVAFSPDGKLLASAGEDRTVRLWDLQTGAEAHALEGHRYTVTAVAFSPDGKLLASAGEDRSVRLWEMPSGKPRRLLEGHGDWVNCLAFSPDGKLLASGGADLVVRIWDVARGESVRVLGGYPRPVTAVEFRTDGRYLAGLSEDGTVRVWDVVLGREAKTYKSEHGLMRTVAFSEDGEELANIRFVHRVDDMTPPLSGHGGAVRCAGFSPDGKWLASTSGVVDEHTHHASGEVKIWAVARRQEVRSLQGHTLLVYAAAWSPDGKRLATVSEDRTVRLWDTAKGSPLHMLGGHEARVTGVTFSPDGKWLATASADRTVKLWDAVTGKELRTLGGHERAVRAVAFSPDGKRLASASADRSVRLWDPLTGKLLQTFTGHEYAVTSVAFSPDGTLLVSGSEDMTARLWNPNTGEQVGLLRGHTDGVTCVAFSPRDRQEARPLRLATASEDQTVKLWDLETGEETLTLKGHRHRVLSVAFSPDGDRLATAGSDQTVRLWDATPLVGEAIPGPAAGQ